MSNQNVPDGVDAKTTAYTLLGIAMAVEITTKAHWWLFSDAQREIAATFVGYLRQQADELGINKP